MKKMKLQKQVLLSYSVPYPDRHDKIEDLLANVPSNTAIELISYNLKKVNPFIGEHDIDIWAPWMMKTRNDVKNPVGQYAKQYNLRNYALIDKYAILCLQRLKMLNLRFSLPLQNLCNHFSTILDKSS